MHRPRFKTPSVQGYSHINIQERSPTEHDLTDPNIEGGEDFVRHESLQEEIEEQLLLKSNPATNPETTTRPLTFAEATMSTKRGRGGRKDSIKGADASLAGPMSLESLGPFKYTFKKKKKKHNKWSPLDLLVADSASEAGSISEVGTGSSRAASPNPQSASDFASFPSSPQRSASTLVVPSSSPADDREGQFIDDADQNHKDIGESHQTPTQNTYEFAAREAKGNEIRPLIYSGVGLSDTDITCQSPTQNNFEFAAPTTQEEVASQLTHLGLNSSGVGSIYRTPTLSTFEFAAGEDKGRGHLLEEGDLCPHNPGETHKTPTQHNFDFTAPVSTSNPHTAIADLLLRRLEHECTLDPVETTTSDTEATKDRTQAAMASIAEAFVANKTPKAGDDLFDSVEWDPDLPSAAAPDSPELVETNIAAPQPRAYTTVGSIVNPNAVPQFTAPNRIQREGAGRRSLMMFMPSRPSMPSRDYESSSNFHHRDLLPPLSMQDSMHYAQQLSQSPVRPFQAQQPTSPHSSRSNMSRKQLSLTKDEVKVLKKMGGPRMVSGNISGFPTSRNCPRKSLSSTISSENKHLLGQLSPPKIFTTNQDLTLPTHLPRDSIDDGQRRNSALSGLEKMHTIQRLAKFDNPMQEVARSRLSALSVTNVLGRTVANPNGLSTSSLAIAESISRKLTAAKQGELDRGYQFPPGFGTISSTQGNPLFGAYGTSTLEPAPSVRSLGVPQPLTAGPPGQRQYLTSSANKLNTSFTQSRQLGGDMNVSTPYADHWQNSSVDPTNQVYLPSIDQQASTLLNPLAQDFGMESLISAPSHQPREPVFEGETVGSRLVDSLPISAVSKYYPRGIPYSMPGQFTALSDDMKVKMGSQNPLSAEEKTAAKRKALDDWFYGGQREYGKDTTDHINDMAHREDLRRGGTFGPIGAPPKKIIQKTPITLEEMNGMTTAEASKPLVDALFSTLLAYADETSDSESRRHLSGFQKPADFLIDDSEKGNESFFGEDWGVPPKRVGGTSRFQFSFPRASTVHWE